MSSAREEFLDRVRQAVNAGNRPGRGSPIEADNFPGFRESDTNTDLVGRFRDRFTTVGGILHLILDVEACIQEIMRLVATKSAKRLLLGGGKLIDHLDLANRLKQTGSELTLVNELDSHSCRDPFFAADIGVSGVDCLVAETGSVVLHSGSIQPRSLSLLPPVHIAIAERNQLVADLFDLFPSSQNESEQTLPSCITFITGPSKTGDIELKLVTGVHGPGEIHVILLES
jgi:L-lactate dehydrogenase complex protein LldG